MKSIKDHKYAVIAHGKVHSIFTGKEVVEWCECGVDNLDADKRNQIHPHCIKTVDITDNDSVKVGDAYPFVTEQIKVSKTNKE